MREVGGGDNGVVREKLIEGLIQLGPGMGIQL